MIVIDIESLKGTEREVQCPAGGFISYRAVLESEGMGFSLHKTVIPEGKPQTWHYKHHKEACYCIEGKGILTNLDSGERFFIGPGKIYLLDSNDPHTFQALEDVVLVSIFNPPLLGREVHGLDNSYPVLCGDPGDDPSRKEMTQ